MTANVPPNANRREIPSTDKYVTFGPLPYPGPSLKPI